MKKMLLIAVAMVLVASAASALTIVGSAHDMRTHISNETSTQVCVYCHTPHMPAGRTQDPLWNHSMSSVGTYGVYSSATMNVTPTEMGGTGASGLLCLSCHAVDGPMRAIDQYRNRPMKRGAQCSLSPAPRETAE